MRRMFDLRHPPSLPPGDTVEVGKKDSQIASGKRPRPTRPVKQRVGHVGRFL